MHETNSPPLFIRDDPDTQKKYLLHSPLEIQSVLQDLAKRPELITAYFDSGKGFVLTSITAILSERKLLVLEPGPDEEMNQRLLKAERATCMAKQQDILVRFTLEPLNPARYQGEPVFAAPLPETLLRLQRREYYRVSTPLVTPLLCRMKLSNDQLIELALSDISAGGLGLLDASLEFEAKVGQVFHDCTLLIPGETALRVDLMTRNLYLLGEDRHNPQLKIGFSFHQPGSEVGNFVRRYVNRLQIQQNRG